MVEHMGKLVRDVMRKKAMRPPVLAQKLGIHKQGMDKIWRRKVFHVSMMEKLSVALDYDFFQHLAKVDMVQFEERAKKILELETEIANLNKEMAALRRENELLVQANNWLSKR